MKKPAGKLGKHATPSGESVGTKRLGHTVADAALPGGAESKDRDLVILAAEKVMGWTHRPRPNDDQFQMWEFHRRDACNIFASPHELTGVRWWPLTQIADAFMLVDALSEKGFAFSLWETPIHSSVLNGPVAALRHGVHPAALNWGDRDAAVMGTYRCVRNADGRCRAIVAACLAAVAHLPRISPPQSSIALSDDDLDKASSTDADVPEQPAEGPSSKEKADV